jgi:hypothetical protein
MKSTVETLNILVRFSVFRLKRSSNSIDIYEHKLCYYLLNTNRQSES